MGLFPNKDERNDLRTLLAVDGIVSWYYVTLQIVWKELYTTNIILFRD